VPVPDPFLDRRGDALYLVERDGTTWRVHDAEFTGGKAHRLPLGSPAANTRYFVAADGTQRAYTFGIAGGRRPWMSCSSTCAARGSARGSHTIRENGRNPRAVFAAAP